MKDTNTLPFRRDQVNLFVYGPEQGQKVKKKIILQNFGRLAFFNLLFPAF